MRRVVISLWILLVFAGRVVSDDDDWRWRCYTPTYLVKAGDYYFLVDCWHHRVLWNKCLTDHLAFWHSLDEELASPHSLASDGSVYLVEDTGRHAVCVYEAAGEGFKRTARIEGLGKRPHRIRYDAGTAAFYVVAADSRDIIKLVREGRHVRVRYTKHLGFLDENCIVRSMTLDAGQMYFVSGPRAITRVSYRDDSYTVSASYRLPDSLERLAGMNDLFHSDDGWWYITATPRQIVRVRTLDELVAGRCEDVAGRLGIRGTPYYLSSIDGRIYLPEITEWSRIVSFRHLDGRIGDLRVLCDFGPPTPADERRKALRPM